MPTTITAIGTAGGTLIIRRITGIIRDRLCGPIVPAIAVIGAIARRTIGRQVVPCRPELDVRRIPPAATIRRRANRFQRNRERLKSRARRESLSAQARDIRHQVGRLGVRAHQARQGIQTKISRGPARGQRRASRNRLEETGRRAHRHPQCNLRNLRRRSNPAQISPDRGGQPLMLGINALVRISPLCSRSNPT